MSAPVDVTLPVHAGRPVDVTLPGHAGRRVDVIPPVPAGRRVDVILPVHGGEAWLEEAIASVVAQTFDGWQLTVVDDASPDASADIVRRAAEAHPGRIELLQNTSPRRAAGARMQAIERTSAELIAFLDQDDIWRPEKLALQVARFDEDAELDALHTDAVHIDAEGRPIPGAADRENALRARFGWGTGPELAARLFDKNAIRLGSAMLRRSAFAAAGGFDATLFGGEDWEFWVRFAARFRIGHLGEPLLLRRVHGSNVSRVHAAERAEGKLRALEQMLEAQPQLGPRAARRRREIRAAAGLPDPPLELAGELFRRLAEASVRYCHWKSNEHVEAALAGRTDFDLLVDPGDRDAFEAVLAELDFKEILAPSEKRFPGMRDRLGFDPTSGGLLHLHVHEQLVLGTPGVKNHRVPIEALLLDGGREIHGVRAPAPELELLLLALRAPLKVSTIRIARRWRKNGTKTLQSAIVREMGFLLPDVDEDRFAAALRKSGLALEPDDVLGFVRAARDRVLTTPQIHAFRRKVLHALRPHRRDPAWRAARRALRARLREPRRRTLPRGRLFALVGADGSGKSTLAGELRQWLGWKLDVEGAYFGLPKSAFAYRTVRRLRRSLGWRWLDAERWLLAARHRAAQHARARGVAARGGVVIADRWPLPELWEPPQPMDGPRLAGHPLAARERALYARIGPPDRAFVLKTPLEVLRRREPDPDPALHARKAELVNRVSSSDVYAVVDGDRPYESVLLDLKRRIWAAL